MGFYLNDYLIVKGISLRKRVSDLFDELEKNPELAQVFVRNPILVLESKILPEFGVSDEDSINAANQFLYSVLSNDKFMKWLENYQTKLINQYNKTGKLPSKKKVLQQFAKGLIENGDPKILRDLLEISPKTVASTYLARNAAVLEHVALAIAVGKVVIAEYGVVLKWDILVELQYIAYVLVIAIGIPPKVSLLDENQKIVTISPKELKSLSEQMVNYAKKMREQTEESKLEE
jgi:hypothetical protein